MSILRTLLAGALAYLIGSISSAVAVSYAVSRKDVRNYGSGNAGATNMARLFGLGVGAATLVLDGLKTVVAMYLGRLIGGEDGFLLSALTCLLGHCFPVYFGFKGGKGISVGAAIGLMLDWRIFLGLVIVFSITFAITRRVSAGSVVSALAFTPLEALAGVRGVKPIALGVVACVLVLWMHRENIKRLIRGEEKVFRPGKLSWWKDK